MPLAVSDAPSPACCRFVKKNGVFYLQIEQGVADRFGYVNASTVAWKPIKKYISVKE